MEKIRLAFDWDKCERMTDNARDLADYANEVAIPILRDLEIPITFENAISVCRHPDNAKTLIFDKELKGSKYERALITEQVTKAYNEVIQPFKSKLKKHPYFRRVQDVIQLNKSGRMEVLSPKIEELCTVYLTEPAEIEARRWHEKICRELTEFVNKSGIIPFTWINLFMMTPSGEIVPNMNVNPYSEIASNTNKK